MNILDPINGANNLGRSVSSANAHKIISACKEGAKRVSEALTQWVGREKVGEKERGEREREREKQRREHGDGSDGYYSPDSEDFDLFSFQSDRDGERAFQLVSSLFTSTLHKYSGRFAFRGGGSQSGRRKNKGSSSSSSRSSAALQILTDEGKLAIATEELVDGKFVSSTSSSPLLTATNSPRLSVSDSEFDTENEYISGASDAENMAHGGAERGERGGTQQQRRGSRLPPPPSFSLNSSSSSLLSSLSPSSSPYGPSSSSSESLDSNLARILENLSIAKSFEVPSVSEEDLVAMIRKLLQQFGSVPVGKLGSLLHNVMNNHSLPSMLKEKYGGLKKFIERHPREFIIGTDHPFNPTAHIYSVYMTALSAAQQQLHAATGGAGGVSAADIQPTPQQILAQVHAIHAMGQSKGKGGGGGGGGAGGGGIHSSSPSAPGVTSPTSPPQGRYGVNTSISPPPSVLSSSSSSSSLPSSSLASPSQFSVGAAEFVPQSSKYHAKPSSSSFNPYHSQLPTRQQRGGGMPGGGSGPSFVTNPSPHRYVHAPPPPSSYDAALSSLSSSSSSPLLLGMNGINGSGAGSSSSPYFHSSSTPPVAASQALHPFPAPSSHPTYSSHSHAAQSMSGGLNSFSSFGFVPNSLLPLQQPPAASAAPSLPRY